MRKRFINGLHIAIIGVLIHSSGCETIDQNRKTTLASPDLTAEENINRATISEKNKDLAKALYFYKAAADIYAKKKKETQANISRISEKMNQAENHINTAISYINQGKCNKARKMIDNAFEIRNDHPKSNELKRKIHYCKQQPVPPKPTPPPPYRTKCKFLKGKEYKHIVKKGDELGALCKRIYGRTGHFKLVHAIVEYNRINPNDLKRGQRIRFPVIQCKNNTYYPIFPPVPPEITPPVITTPTLTPDDTEETYKHDHYNQGVEYFDKGLFAEAKYEFDLVIQKDADYLDVMQKMEEATLGGMIKNGGFLFDKAQYDEAIHVFQEVKSLQRDNGIAIEYLHKAYFEKAKKWYEKQKLSQTLSTFEKCFSYRCPTCMQYKKLEKNEILSKIALSLEKKSKSNINKDILQQQQKALKLLKKLKPNDQAINNRLAETQKLLDGFE